LNLDCSDFEFKQKLDKDCLFGTPFSPRDILRPIFDKYLNLEVCWEEGRLVVKWVQLFDIGGVTAREVEAGGEGGEGGGETSGLVDGGALVAIPPLPEAAEAGDEGEEGLEGGWGEGYDQGQQDFFLPLLPIVADQEQVQEAAFRGVGEEVVRLLMDSGTDPRREEMKTVNLCVKARILPAQLNKARVNSPIFKEVPNDRDHTDAMNRYFSAVPE